MGVYGLKINRNMISKKIETVTTYDVNTGRVSNVSANLIKVKLKRDSNYINNLYLDNCGNIKVKSINKNAGYYKIGVKSGMIYECYVVILGYNNGFIHYIACDRYNEIKHMIATLGEMLYELDIDFSELNVSNARLRILEDKLNVTIFDLDTGEKTENIHEDKAAIAEKLRAKLGRYSSVNITDFNGKSEISIDCGVESEVKIPDKIERVGSITGAYRLIAGEETEEIGGYSLYEDNNIKELDCNSSVKVIGDYSFKSSTLNRVTNCIGVEYIGKEAFSDSCIKGDIELAVKEIGQKAFYYTAIKSLKLIGTKKVRKGAFAYTYNLKSVDLGKSIEEIEELAFDNSSLKEVKIPRSCRIIRNGAFRGCKKLKKVYVPLETYIENGAFDRRCRVITY